MNKGRILYWLPRGLGIAYLLFLALFALDVFIPGKDLAYYLTALFMHLIPNFVLAILLAIAWRREKIGGVLFIMAFLIMLGMFWGRSSILMQLSLFSPLLVIGILFISRKGS